MPRIVRDIQLLVNDDDDHLYGYRLSDGTEVRIGSSQPDNAAAVVGAAGRSGANVLIIGDSISFQNGGPGTSEERRWANYGYFPHLNAKTRGALNVVANLGVAGQTTATLVTRLPELLTYDAGLVFWIVSGNDTAAGAATSDLLANIGTVLDTLTDAGKVVVAATIPPRALSGTGSFSTSEMQTQVAITNAYLTSYALTNSRVRVADVWSQLANPADGSPYSGVMRDSPAIHPSPWGAQLIADAFFDAIQGRYGNAPLLGYVGSPYNLISTDLASWTASTPVGSVTSTDSTTATGSDGRNNWLQIDATVMSAAGATRRYTHANITTGWSVGDIIQCAVEAEVDSATDIRSLNFIAQCNGGGANLETMSGFAASTGLTVLSTQPQRRLMYVSPAWAIPSGTTSISPRLDIVAGSASSIAKVRWRNPVLINRTLRGY